MSSFSLYWMLEKIVSQCKTISMDYGGYLEKEMATHSSVLAWRIPGTGACWAAVYGVAQSRDTIEVT